MVVLKSCREKVDVKITNKTLAAMVWKRMNATVELKEALRIIENRYQPYHGNLEVGLDKKMPYQFRAEITMGGNEGIYVDCYLEYKGNGKRKVIPCDTFKTLGEGTMDYIHMGMIAGASIQYANSYLVLNLYEGDLE